MKGAPPGGGGLVRTGREGVKIVGVLGGGGRRGEARFRTCVSKPTTVDRSFVSSEPNELSFVRIKPKPV